MFGQRGECGTVTFGSGALVIAQGEAFEHLVDAVFDFEQAPGAGFLGR
ncbi:hypothetical protein [Actinokineospora sp. UTMC 2448]|nr:hypothetical protein [Actinokineospora sp. UTMC 2448]UVS78208.1 hypothetical protein Actkin_01932 [Actinokineospora sp. UTMC 2448]